MGLGRSPACGYRHRRSVAYSSVRDWAASQIWLAFTARALIDPELRAQHAEVHDALHQACASAIQTLADADQANAIAATALQTERLHALTDGLAVHTALRPDLMPPEHIVAVVRLHLDALENEPGPAQRTARA